jgi:hypothetical protein
LLTRAGWSNDTSPPDDRVQAERRADCAREPIGDTVHGDRLGKELDEGNGRDCTDPIARLAPLVRSRDFNGQFSQDHVTALADVPRGNPSPANQQARMADLCSSDSKGQNYTPCRRAQCIKHVR